MMRLFKLLQAQKKAYAAQRQRHLVLQAEQQALLQSAAQSQHLMATVSHALRTPMNAILGFLHLVHTRAVDTPDALHLLQGMRRSADHLLTVINDVLDDASLDTGTLALNPETFALRDTLNVAFDLFRVRAQEAGLNYTFVVGEDVPLWMHTDRHRLTQVLVNLLGNALKFTAQGRVTLRVEWTPEGVRFSVEDTGVGIAEADQTRIFERFEQAEPNTQQRYGGHGLGLAISQRLVNLMGGHIHVHSTRGNGATFEFTLPCARLVLPEASQHRVVAEQTDTRPDTAFTFLVVDDHDINRMLLTQLLKTHWTLCEVLEAQNGAQALACLQTHHVDLVLMDMVMPEMDGIETTLALRQRHSATELPVLGLTANIHPQDLARFNNAGANAIVLKPFDAATLCAQIQPWLKEKKSSQGS